MCCRHRCRDYHRQRHYTATLYHNHTSALTAVMLCWMCVLCRHGHRPIYLLSLALSSSPHRHRHNHCQHIGAYVTCVMITRSRHVVVHTWVVVLSLSLSLCMDDVVVTITITGLHLSQPLMQPHRPYVSSVSGQRRGVQFQFQFHLSSVHHDDIYSHTTVHQCASSQWYDT